MNCPNCNSPVAENAKFCGVCGTPINATTENTQTFTPPPNQNPPIQQTPVAPSSKKKSYTTIGIIAAIAIGWYAYSSYTSHLHDGKAKDLISQKFGLPEAITVPVQHGLIRFANYDNYSLNLYNALAEKKIITVTNKGMDGYYYKNIQIDLSPSASKYKLRDSSDRQGREFYIMKAGDRVFGSITGIKESSDGRVADVEFTWGYSDVTPVGEAMAAMKSQPDQFKSTITCAKYDNGWEIKQGFDFRDLWQDLGNELNRKYRY